MAGIDDLMQAAREKEGGRALTGGSDRPFLTREEVADKIKDHYELIAEIREKYGKYIDHEAKRHNIDPHLIAAIIAKESRGDKRAGSGAGAQGLMQLMGPTAEEHGVTDRFDPKQSIKGGSAELARLIRAFGAEDKALAAYNFGWGNMRKFEAGKKKLPRETREYVPIVLGVRDLSLTPEPAPEPPKEDKAPPIIRAMLNRAQGTTTERDQRLMETLQSLGEEESE